jgi:hypothetical protein
MNSTYKKQVKEKEERTPYAYGRCCRFVTTPVQVEEQTGKNSCHYEIGDTEMQGVLKDGNTAHDDKEDKACHEKDIQHKDLSQSFAVVSRTGSLIDK